MLKVALNTINHVLTYTGIYDFQILSRNGGATSGTRTIYPSVVPEFTPVSVGLLLLNLRGTRVHPGFSRVIVVQSLVLLYVVVCGPYFCLFAFCSLLAIAFSLWFVCLSFDIQHLVIPLVSLKISYEYSYAQCSQRKYNAVNNTH